MLNRFILLLFLIVFLGLVTKAQKFMTNREIYSFEVGDVIHIDSWLDTGPSQYTKRYFNSKQYSINLDSVYYGATDSILTYNLQSHLYELTTLSHTILYHNLDSFPRPIDVNVGLYGTPFQTNQRIDINLCLDTINEYEYSSKDPLDTILIDNGYWSTVTFVKGLGFYYSFTEDGGSSHTRYTSLEYYKKVSSSCGKPVTAGISEYLFNFKKLIIYPNPAQDHFILLPLTSGEISIYDCTGKLILNENSMNRIPVAQLESGIYFIILQKDDSIYRTSFLKE